MYLAAGGGYRRAADGGGSGGVHLASSSSEQEARWPLAPPAAAPLFSPPADNVVACTLNGLNFYHHPELVQATSEHAANSP